MTKLNPLAKNKNYFEIKVRIIKAPLVDSNILRQILRERARALVL